MYQVGNVVGIDHAAPARSDRTDRPCRPGNPGVGHRTVFLKLVVLTFPAVEAAIIVLGQFVHKVRDLEDLVDVLHAAAEAEGA